ncbi:MAG TPA: fluoride efflux transporter CrcB [bacterium]|nr:fluoride efflux transporter CrcB [Candidatus Omnitrophota bacterium]HOJ60481.1 fluoride efflux transporter CrcB [bacterium]HOL93839.1 fluoride efflux transporter CrcB [bacterium]HPP01790.1 fluoride efflux transporter CrcB [bacterium]HXK92044.1 fluoride efflux transporter CrcB [bacterium]
MRGFYPYLLVGLGGFLGANLRFIVARLSAQYLGIAFPYGTFIINITGSFFLGLIGTLLAQRVILFGEEIRLAVSIGFLGAFTTFSTFEFESHALFDNGNWMLGLTNLLASLFAGLLAVRLGINLAAIKP